MHGMRVYEIRLYVYDKQFVRAGALATGITAGFVVSTLYKVRRCHTRTHPHLSLSCFVRLYALTCVHVCVFVTTSIDMCVCMRAP